MVTFSLISIDNQGIGNENGCINTIYSYLLYKHGLTKYKHIRVNQIGNDRGIEEFVSIEKGRAYVSIDFQTNPDFHNLPVEEQELIRLEVAHNGLLRLAEVDDSYSIEIINEVKAEVLKKEFHFEIQVQFKLLDKKRDIISHFIVVPSPTYFQYFFVVREKDKNECKVLLFRGMPNDDYFRYFFSTVKYSVKGGISIDGSAKQMRIIINPVECSIDFINLTNYPKPPLWEMFRVGADVESNIAYENWIHSLPPHVAAIIKEHRN